MNQRSVIFAESPKPLADESAGPLLGLPHSVSAPSVPSSQLAADTHSSESPVPPAEVLNREVDLQDTTSAGAAVALQTEESRLDDDGVVLRGKYPLCQDWVYLNLTPNFVIDRQNACPCCLQQVSWTTSAI